MMTTGWCRSGPGAAARVETAGLGRPTPRNRQCPRVPDLGKYEGGDYDDNYRHRMMVNLAALGFTAVLAVVGVWLVIQLADLRKPGLRPVGRAQLRAHRRQCARALRPIPSPLSRPGARVLHEFFPSPKYEPDAWMRQDPISRQPRSGPDALIAADRLDRFDQLVCATPKN